MYRKVEIDDEEEQIENGAYRSIDEDRWLLSRKLTIYEIYEAKLCAIYKSNISNEYTVILVSKVRRIQFSVAAKGLPQKSI